MAIENTNLSITTLESDGPEYNATSAFSNTNESSPTDICVVKNTADSVLTTFHLSAILLLATVCVFVNSLVLYVLVKACMLTTPLNCFICSLAVSDLIQGIVYPIYNIGHLQVPSIRAILGHWPVCCVMMLFVISTLASSAFSIVGIAVLRFLAVRWPLTHTKMVTPCRLRLAISAVWGLSFAYGSAFAFEPKPKGYCGLCMPELYWKLYQKLSWLLVSTMLPVILLAIMNCLIHHQYRKHMQRMMTIRRGMGQQRHQAENMLSWVSTFLVAYLFLSYLPYIIYSSYLHFCNCEINGYFRSVARIILFSNTNMNFFLYAVAHWKFRREMFRILCHARFVRHQSRSHQ